MRKYGGRYSTQLGIHLADAQPSELFKWFLASILFGARITETIGIRTYRVMEIEEVLSPKVILEKGWDRLVEILDSGGYVRYDFKTATKILEMSKNLIEQYQGDLNRLHAASANSEDLERRLKSFAKGIGDVTVNIFLREMRGVWEKAKPTPLDLAVNAAHTLAIIPRKKMSGLVVLNYLLKAWKNAGKKAKNFPDLEAALVRAGKDLKKREKRIRKLQMSPEDSSPR